MKNKLILILFVLIVVNLSAYAEDHYSTGQLVHISIEEGFLTIDDVSFAFDNLTQVYDANGQLRSIKSLKPGETANLYLRKQSGSSIHYPNRILDKIIYFSK